MHKLPGVESNTGALGHGLSLGVGMALGIRVDGGDQKVFVAMGDGELAEGSNWEAAAAASHHQLDNLLVFVDRNRLQIGGPTVEIMSYEPLDERWKAFGWEVQTISAHDMKAIVESAVNFPAVPGKPTCIILDSVKAKGLSFAEDKVEYHYWKANQDEMAKADKDLAEIEARLTCKEN
jgi:transketolase